MTFFVKRISLATAGAGMLLVSATNIAFAQTTITGNGASSVNSVVISTDCVSSVSQSNKTIAYTDISSVATTGKNTASGNTGGSVSVETGDASSTVSVAVLGGDNSASAPTCCGCESGPVDATITGNGTSSHNSTTVSATKALIQDQKSKVKVSTFVSSKTSTGKNKAKKNTGSGISVSTGGADSSVDVTVAGGSNQIQ